MSYPRSETTAAYVTNNRKKLYVFLSLLGRTRIIRANPQPEKTIKPTEA